MATFTITTTVNADALTSKGGADIYNVNGGTVTFDRHTRYGLNPSNSHGSINGSATLGGTIKFRSDKIRLIYFTGGSGTVPVYETVISQGGASGLLIGVHAGLDSAPLTPGDAMPATGYLQVTQWNSVAYASGALTGISATCAADPVFGTFDRVGFMINVARDSTNTNISRLNNPSDDPFLGDWFLVGITDGTRATAYQIPDNGDAMYFGGVQVETAPGSGVFEWWPVTTSPMLPYNIRTTGEASKQCWIDPANAQVRFGHDGTNSTGGACPASGCIVRVPNLFLQGCTAGSPTVNSFSAINSRHYFYGNGAGRWRMTGVSSAWRHNLITNCYELYIKDTSMCHTLTISSNATPYEIDNICISTPVDDAVANSALVLNSTFVGGTITDSVFSVGEIDGVNKNPLSISSATNGSFDNCKFLYSGMPNVSAACMSTSIGENFDFQDCYFLGRHVHSQSVRFTAQNCVGGGISPGDPFESNSGVSYISMSNKCSNFLFEDWTFPETETLGKGLFIQLSGSSVNNKFRNMGSYASPISSRSAVQYDLPWTRSGSTITVTWTGHPIRTGDYLKTLYTTSTAATGNSGLEQATYINANTFSFVGAASGDASGTITLFRVWASDVISVGIGCENNEFQNIFVDGAYSNSVSAAANGNRNTYLNIDGGIGAGASYAGNDMIVRGVNFAASIPAASSAQYGHTFADGPVHSSPAPCGGIADGWTRSGSTALITHASHGIEHSNTRIRFYDPSDTATFVPTVAWKYAQPVTEDTFSVPVAASGGLSGTVSWDAPTDKTTLFMNEESDSVSRYTIDSGTPAFTGAGALSAITAGDQITWEMPEYLINYTGFADMPIETSLAETLAAQGQFRFMYDIATDDGAFSGTYKNLSLILTQTSGTSGTPTMTFASTANIAANDKITGAHIPRGTYVVSVDSATQITLSANLLGTATGDYMFNHLPSETFTTNFKLKVRQITLTTNALANTYINIPLTSDATSRAETYPIVIETVDITVTGIAAGYRIQIYNVTQATEIENTTTTGATYSYVVTTEADDGDVIRVRLAKDDKIELQQSAVFSSASGATILAEPEDDDVWTAYGVDGSLLTAYAWDSANSEIEINESGTTWSQKDLYAWYKYFITTATGVDEVFGLIEAKDAGNIELGAVKLDNLDSNSLAPEDEIRVYRSDDTWIVINPTTGGGDLGVYSTGTIYVKNINTATNVITGDIADVATAIENAVSVWSDDDAYTAGQKGKLLKDAADNAELGAIK